MLFTNLRNPDQPEDGFLTERGWTAPLTIEDCEIVYGHGWGDLHAALAMIEAERCEQRDPNYGPSVHPVLLEEFVRIKARRSQSFAAEWAAWVWWLHPNTKLHNVTADLGMDVESHTCPLVY